MNNILQKSGPFMVSVVVPCNHDFGDLKTLLFEITKGTLVPNEIIVVNSNPKSIIYDKDDYNEQVINEESVLFDRFRVLGIKLIIINKLNVFPGDARNIGIKNTTGEIIAFLDVKTIPTCYWLKKACDSLKNKNIQGVWGSTIYKADSYVSSIILDAIYGRKPLRSIPGTVMKKECLSVIGQMVSWVPAGEDGDWMARINAHKLNFKAPLEHNTTYCGLANKNINYFIKKWWSYYNLSRMFPVNDRDRWVSYILSYALIIFLAFNWNYQISEFIFGTYILVPHITKTVLIFGLSIYLILRGIYLPLARGVPLFQLLPFRFIQLIIITTILDIVKTMALLMPSKILEKLKIKN